MKGFARFTMLATLLVFFVGFGMVSIGETAPALYRGEVWTWDEPTSTVTLRQGSEIVRIKLRPDQMVGLRLHEFVTVMGEAAGPAEIEHVILPAVAMEPVPKGAADRAEMTGTIAALEPSGVAAVKTDRGTVSVWTATGGEGRYAPGTPVRIRTSVQEVDMIPQKAAAKSDVDQPAASPGGEPGDYAVVTGRVLSVDPSGSISVESPRGPITVFTADAVRFRPGTFVQVRTAIQPVQ